MEPSNSLGGARIALLIDFDNVILGIDEPGFDIELVVNALRERGTITVSRVYGDWYRHSRHRRKLMEHGVELVEAPAFGPVIKNSADIKIALDGYEIGMTMPHINTFCLVSGDSDFLPLIKKLQSLGKQVLVICGNRFTSDMLRRNCNEFISYENLLAASYGADEDATTLEGAFALLHRAMAALRERGSEIRTSTLKQMMIQLNPVFSEKTFGYNQFRGFLDKAGREGLIKLGPRDRVSGEFYVLLPEEDEAEVIEQIERAEPAQVVEEIVESRRGRNRRGERNGVETGRNGNNTRESRHETAPVEAEEEQRPRSRREARLQALREQEELEQQAPAPQISEQATAPLATPLTPATDFSPADADEVRQKSIARAELLARGMHVGKVRFSGKTGKAETATRLEQPSIEPDIALTPEDVTDAEIEVETATPAPAATPETETLNTPEAKSLTEETLATPEKSKRSRSRRRKKTSETPAEITALTEAIAPDSASETEAASDAATSQDETPATGESAATTEAVPAEEAPAEALSAEALSAEEALPSEKKTRRRRTTRKKAEEKSAEGSPNVEIATTNEKAEDDVTQDETPAAQNAGEEKPKPKRTRRRKKTEEVTENMEKAVQGDGTEQTVSDEALIEASADTPAAKAEEKLKPKRRRTSRKQAEEKADVKAGVSENIVTGETTTGEVTSRELTEIPVPQSEDEL